MELRHLVTFHKVATVLSFTRAAAELNYAQSSVTAQIRSLETELQTELFERLGSKIQLTGAGQRLLPYAGQIIALIDEAQAEAKGSTEPSGTLAIGTMESITSYRLPPLLELFHHRYPRVQLRLRPSLCAETYQALRQGVFDVGFLMDTRTEYEGLNTVVLAAEPMALVAAPTHPLASAQEVTVADLNQAQVLATEVGCAYREAFETELTKGSGEPQQFLEFGTIEAIKRGVTAGLGISLLPRITVEDELSQGTLRQVAWEPPFELFTQLAWRHGRRLPRELQLFIDQTLTLIQEEQSAQAETA
ncbi:LysR family transcriptional regulator [Streptacidiphilus fuscans]|uniref:LysR family transcriptional regulator n=1 Tax=Streptacidiphilus fuscans TaxID=2789292 RepID=A0A931B0H8_9ACTN|nr:LysR family transcriptional regulator [Streptacidiphilus fuscans]MBF9068081.1 LysR family transcriptional regulator [Streptacidiphilus fuscans]